ncbi:transcriptional repressor [Candidatus Peregrinibacteria bacterium]|nr:transcriptional repressor [Candidatus Peregrinibacteria bacterium]
MTPEKYNQRLTKQKIVIMEELRKVCSHPTASEIYKMVKKRLPTIGLATVYRNLSSMAEDKMIIKLHSKGKEARYDGNTSNHCHLICKKCGHVIDIFDIKDISIKSNQLNESEFVIDYGWLEIHGLCKKCS